MRWAAGTTGPACASDPSSDAVEREAASRELGRHRREDVTAVKRRARRSEAPAA